MKSFAAIWCITFLCHGICVPPNDTTSQELSGKHDSAAQTLAVGDSHSFCVDSRKFFNATETCLVAGDCYTFHVAACSNWIDLQIVADANGWTSNQAPFGIRRLVHRMETRRRCPTANWFELVGTIGKNECYHFRIGCGDPEKTYSPTVSGPLYAFANDVPSKYHNNRGSIRVTVTRVK